MAEAWNDLALKKRIRKLEQRIEELEARLKEKSAELFSAEQALREEIRNRESAQTALEERDSRLRGLIEEAGCDLPREEEGTGANPSGSKEIENAIAVLFERNRIYRKELEEKILYNISRLVMPHIDNLLERMLDIPRDPGGSLSGGYPNPPSPLYSAGQWSGRVRLTLAESRVADLLKKGHRTREIAEILNLSDKTIETHRKKIRKKLGLSHQKANLKTYLRSIQYPP